MLSLTTASEAEEVAAFVGGGLVSRITDRPFLRGALRQLLLAGVAAGTGIAVLATNVLTWLWGV